MTPSNFKKNNVYDPKVGRQKIVKRQGQEIPKMQYIPEAKISSNLSKGSQIVLLFS